MTSARSRDLAFEQLVERELYFKEEGRISGTDFPCALREKVLKKFTTSWSEDIPSRKIKTLNISEDNLEKFTDSRHFGYRVPPPVAAELLEAIEDKCLQIARKFASRKFESEESICRLWEFWETNRMVWWALRLHWENASSLGLDRQLYWAQFVKKTYDPWPYTLIRLSLNKGKPFHRPSVFEYLNNYSVNLGGWPERFYKKFDPFFAHDNFRFAETIRPIVGADGVPLIFFEGDWNRYKSALKLAIPFFTKHEFVYSEKTLIPNSYMWENRSAQWFDDDTLRRDSWDDTNETIVASVDAFVQAHRTAHWYLERNFIEQLKKEQLTVFKVPVIDQFKVMKRGLFEDGHMEVLNRCIVYQFMNLPISYAFGKYDEEGVFRAGDPVIYSQFPNQESANKFYDLYDEINEAFEDIKKCTINKGEDIKFYRDYQRTPHEIPALFGVPYYWRMEDFNMHESERQALYEDRPWHSDKGARYYLGQFFIKAFRSDVYPYLFACPQEITTALDLNPAHPIPRGAESSELEREPFFVEAGYVSH